jgi:hypothetical protein
MFLGKNTPKYNILCKFPKDILPLLRCMFIDVAFGDFALPSRSKKTIRMLIVLKVYVVHFVEKKIKFSIFI